jgi:hypothetical protein
MVWYVMLFLIFQDQHAVELSRVDEKVREALHAKDEAISALRRELMSAESRCREAEDLLAALNSDIAIH